MMEKALRVCATCKTRKKACDKCLPICGYCDKRNLTCVYYEEEGHYYPVQRSDPLTTAAMTVDGLVYVQLRHVVSLAGFSIREMIDEFFRGVHIVFPVISADDDFLWGNLSVYEEYQQFPSADFALVVLAMYLLTMRSSPPLDGHSTTPLFEEKGKSIETVYVTTKKLLSHVQALRTSSIHLVQASLLVAAFEYACFRPYAAYVSIGVCSRMAIILGSGTHSHREKLRTVLGELVFRGIVLLERLIACEVDIPFTPSLGNYQQSTKVEHQDQHNIVTDSEEKALRLLDRVLHLTKSPEHQDRRAELETFSALQRVGSELQGFLSDSLDCLTTKDCAGSYIVIATAIRSLFLLHRYILDTLTSLALPPSSTTDNIPMTMYMQETSLNTLDTATRIMIDTSHDHVEYGVPHTLETFPLCGGYNLRCAMEHLKTHGSRERRGSQRDIIIDGDLARLEDLYGGFCRRWKPIDCKW